MKRSLKHFWLWMLIASFCWTTQTAMAQESIDAAEYKAVVAKGLDYLKLKGQADDGSFNAQTGPGITALVTSAMIKNGLPIDAPSVAKALKFIEAHQKNTGGIHAEGSVHRNYETSLSLLCLVDANIDGRYDDAIKKADRFLRGIQWDEDEGKTVADFDYGGQGYGSHARPDLSNTTFFVEAVVAAGAQPDDEALQRALVFISRSQNLESEHNTTPFAGKNPDGGFYYTPAAGGTSQAGETQNGGLRSYASMTYAGLKSMIYAGVTADDPRVKAAVKWLGDNYDLDSNPGMGTAGLFYYYHTFAKALDAMGQDTFSENDGTVHYWKAELFNELKSRQLEDGSWVNSENSRWLEDDANLVTAYALMALAYCQPEE